MRASGAFIRVLSVAGILTVAGAAGAQSDEDYKIREKAGSELGQFANAIADVDHGGGHAGGRWPLTEDPGACRAALAKVKAAGMKADAWMLSSAFKRYPGTEGGARQWKQTDNYEYPFAKASELCAAYEARRMLAVTLYPEMSNLDGFISTLDLKAHMKPGELGDDWWKGPVDKGTQCGALVDKLVAAGAPTDLAVGWRQTHKWTLAEYKQNVCQALLDWGNELKTGIGAAKQADRDKIAAKYKAHGIKGKRLELFVEYDSVYWRGKGCEIIDDVKVLAKAKKLHHWLENDDGTHTIRTYTFKGDNYTSKDKRYKKEKDAYKGCK